MMTASKAFPTWSRQLFCLALLLIFMVSCATKTRVIVSSHKRAVNSRTGKYYSNKKRATQRPYKIKGRTYYPLPSSEGFVQTGVASWYGRPFHGRKTSNGETYNMYKRSAAHKTLPMGTNVLVTNLDNGRETTLRINDRGPFVRGRIIDLSYQATKELGVVKKGTARVRIAALGEAVAGSGKQTAPKFLPHQDFNQGNFYIQVGAFTKQSNANRLQTKLSKQGYQVSTSSYTNKQGTHFTRIRIDAGHDLRQAKKLVAKIRQQGHKGAFVAAR